MAENQGITYWKFIGICSCLMSFPSIVKLETETCKLQDRDVRPGSACDCNENIEKNLCFVSKVRFENGDCGDCEAGHYLKKSPVQCEPCPPNYNCERNVYENCRPCEKKYSTTTISTAIPKSTPTTQMKIQDETVSRTTAETHKTSESTTMSSKASTTRIQKTTKTTTSSTTSKNEKKKTDFNTVEIFLISLAVVISVIIIACCILYRFRHSSPLRPYWEKIMGISDSTGRTPSGNQENRPMLDQ